MHNALGFATLKATQQHYEQQQTGTQQVVWPELQRLFDLGIENEINAVSKILPMFYSELIYFQDVCAAVTHPWVQCYQRRFSGEIWPASHKFHF